MSLPLVVIVGRPNVGKSSLLNCLARERISIVDPRAGVTRDRVTAVVEHEERYFELVDTGGIGIVDQDHLEEHVETQIRFAIDRATLVLFMLDVTDGQTPLDQAIAEQLRQAGKPVIVLANKCDDIKHEPLAGELHALGFGAPFAVSALHARGRPELLDRIVAALADVPAELPQEPAMRLAIVGKRNAGKSTLVNALAGEERVIVSEIPGTTRDAVDVRFQRDGREFVAIDTAGVRKKTKMSDIDFYSYTRAVQSIARADVVLFLIDALVPIAEVDLKLAREILDHHKPVVISVNKWDLAKGQAAAEDYGAYLTRVMPLLRFAPITFMTAKTGRNVQAAIDVAQSLHKQNCTRLGTGELNRVLEGILAERGPSQKHGLKPVRIYYATQVSTAPPTIVFFCNDPALVSENYRRYMENRLRAMTVFKEVPLRLWMRPRREKTPSAEA